MSDEAMLYIPDISGFTDFVNSTEIEHSRHIIAELLEILIDSNQMAMNLAEVEGDALFFYKVGKDLKTEDLLNQVEFMFSRFHSFLHLFERQRICPCRACASVGGLQLKVIGHYGPIEFIELKGVRKPFGQEVIAAHRLLKNSVRSKNYVLMSHALMTKLDINTFDSKELYSFENACDTYDGKEIKYFYSHINASNLPIQSSYEALEFNLERKADIRIEREFSVSAKSLYELITNYKYRTYWASGADGFEYNERQVTRIGTEHACIIDGSKLEFKTVAIPSEPGNLTYGEFSTSPPMVDEFYQLYWIKDIEENKSLLRTEVHLISHSTFRRWALQLLGISFFRRGLKRGIDGLEEFSRKQKELN